MAPVTTLKRLPLLTLLAATVVSMVAIGCQRGGITPTPLLTSPPTASSAPSPEAPVDANVATGPRSPEPAPTPTRTPTPTLVSTSSSVMVLLSPQEVKGSSGDILSLDLLVSPGGLNLSDAYVMLSFEPGVLVFLDAVLGQQLDPTTTTLVQKVDEENGNLCLSLGGLNTSGATSPHRTLVTMRWRVPEESPPREISVDVVSATLHDEAYRLIPRVATNSASVKVVQSLWIRHRLEAISNLYRITQEGREVMARLDVRQMRGQPGFFGSYGFKGWTGLGEAKITPAIHELSHAYWGAFPINGYPDLSWEAPEGDDLSTAMQKYHDDAIRFLTQPPDSYEVFRQRLRNLPGLSSDNLEPLFHTLEADMVSMVGGDLALIPPILRRYWSRFLQMNSFSGWDDAIGWYLGLPPSERSLADQYLGFQHLDLREYLYLAPDHASHLNVDVPQLLEREEMQRLSDFADQFDLLLADPGQEENFSFWRGYLGDMREIYRKHRELLDGSDAPNADRISESLGFFLDIEGMPPPDRAFILGEALSEKPFLAHFLPMLDNATLLDLFGSGVELPAEATLKGTAAFVERLNRFVPPVERILAAGSRSPVQGAQELAAFLPSVDLDNRNEIDLLFEMMVDRDEEVAKHIATALDAETQRTLLASTPVLLRRLMDPPDLLGALGVTSEAAAEEMVAGISLMIRHPTGNFIIDEPYWDLVYSVVTTRIDRESREMLEVIATSSLPLERFIYLHPKAASAVFSSDLELTLKLVKGSDPVVLAPARFVYALIWADPTLAAQVVERLDQDAEHSLVLESLAQFAYDAPRVEANPRLPIDVKNDGLFLQTLLEERGRDWLEERLRSTAELYRTRIEVGEVCPDFLKAYRASLEAAAVSVDRPDMSRVLGEAIKRVFE